ncbi:MAG: type IV toxin-antitoxin system AbiEi family antitoxin domain-containing protein [Lentisphaeria bacterium]|nr:type IV toxin-antitoxin system AbiEi family antitoxin domain-containing protein [Lentisphaeria bacterium]
MDMRTFLAKHPVFTRAELEDALRADYSTNRDAMNARLAHHVRAGHVVQIQRGLYASVPAGTDPPSFVPDLWLVAAKLTADAVIAYHSAFQFHGRAYSVSNEYVFLSSQPMRPKEYRGCRFRRVAYPKALRTAGKEQFGAETVDRQGLDIRVASLERSLVDVLDRPDLGGGWEEIWRSIESVEYYDIQQVVNYALLLGNATTAARVGFFLEQHREQLMVDDSQLDRLKETRPRQPHYMKPGTTGRLAADWNLIVPENILARVWETEI